MTRLAVGPSWAGMNPAQQQQVTQAFGRYIGAVYADRFDSFSGEKLEVTGTQQSTGGTIITSRIVKSTGEPVEINYLMRQSSAGWQIADVYLNGTISELATRRSEFSSILQTQGVTGLIATLNGKAAALGASRTS
jgi:phospholipid transport system substrate-binding protein